MTKSSIKAIQPSPTEQDKLMLGLYRRNLAMARASVTLIESDLSKLIERKLRGELLNLANGVGPISRGGTDAYLSEIPGIDTLRLYSMSSCVSDGKEVLVRCDRDLSPCIPKVIEINGMNFHLSATSKA